MRKSDADMESDWHPDFEIDSGSERDGTGIRTLKGNDGMKTGRSGFLSFYFILFYFGFIWCLYLVGIYDGPAVGILLLCAMSRAA